MLFALVSLYTYIVMEYCASTRGHIGEYGLEPQQVGAVGVTRNFASLQEKEKM